jgi:hypothetical protein
MKLPQLSLRELFLLVVIAAVSCGWWVDRSALRAELKRFQRETAKYLLSLPPTGANYDPALVLPVLEARP